MITAQDARKHRNAIVMEAFKWVEKRILLTIESGHNSITVGVNEVVGLKSMDKWDALEIFANCMEIELGYKIDRSHLIIGDVEYITVIF